MSEGCQNTRIGVFWSPGRHQTRRSPTPVADRRIETVAAILPVSARGGARRVGFPAEEALPAIDRPPLRGLERHGGLAPALRATGHGLGLGEAARRTLALGFTRLAALGLVLKILVVEEV